MYAPKQLLGSAPEVPFTCSSALIDSMSSSMLGESFPCRAPIIFCIRAHIWKSCYKLQPIGSPCREGTVNYIHPWSVWFIQEHTGENDYMIRTEPAVQSFQSPWPLFSFSRDSASNSGLSLCSAQVNEYVTGPLSIYSGQGIYHHHAINHYD